MKSNPETEHFYQSIFNDQTQNAAQLQSGLNRFSWIRIAWFLGSVVGLIVLFPHLSLALFLVVAFLLLALFVAIIIRQNKIREQLKYAQTALSLAEKEMQALKGDYHSFENGAAFSEKNHPFTSDLDVFGSNSLFQMLNRSFSDRGKAKLADGLRNLLNDKTKIEIRQNALKELAEKRQMMFDFRVAGELAFRKESVYDPDPNRFSVAIEDWFARSNRFLNPFYSVLLWVLPLVSLAMFVLYVRENISFSIFLIYLMAVLIYSGRFAKEINRRHAELNKQTQTLFRFQALFAFVEKQNFSNTLLNELKNEFFWKGFSASQALKKLAKISQAFDTRLNVFGWLFLNYFLLWDIRQSRRLEQWKQTFAHQPERAFEALAQLEFLVSLATFYNRRSDLIFPEITDEKVCLEGKQMGHPLMKSEKRVDNDVSFQDHAQFYIITGANMAGKSTYLRTLGTNLVLAQAGAPVCASAFKTSPMIPFTSIKTSDSLNDNESYFYAELLRLQQIIKALQSEQKYFIILDEILKGTNSRDKEQGSRALVQKLIALDAVGLIATHDLQLADLAKQFPNHISAWCFEVEISDNQLKFDYKLRPGVSQNMNATFLLKQMEIT